jgi:hypothetical protein
MKRLPYIVGLGILLILLSFIFNGNDDSYQQEIDNYWDDRIDFLQNSEASPYIQRNLPYQPISYYKADKKYKVNATLDRFTKRSVLSIQNSDGTTTNYLRFAFANFKLNGKQQRLLILKTLGFGTIYFTAFADQTSGETTYGGGRYLDLEIGKSNDIIIDFNKAYNPYCAYVDDYTCPLPPKENLLTIRIEAGERYTN